MVPKMVPDERSPLDDQLHRLTCLHDCLAITNLVTEQGLLLTQALKPTTEQRGHTHSFLQKAQNLKMFHCSQPSLQSTADTGHGLSHDVTEALSVYSRMQTAVHETNVLALAHLCRYIKRCSLHLMAGLSPSVKLDFLKLFASFKSIHALQCRIRLHRKSSHLARKLFLSSIRTDVSCH